MDNKDYTYTENIQLNSLYTEFAENALETKLKNPRLFVLNFLIKKSELISELNISDDLLQGINIDSNNEISLSSKRKLKKYTSILKEKLRETKTESELVTIKISPEREPSLESIREGLLYKGNNDTSYSDIPSTYTLSNY